jgi:hypothetical protein
MNPFRDAPTPSDTHLRLVAGGVETCDDANRSVEGVTVNETASQVVVGAEIRSEGGSLGCELRDFEKPFAVNLSRRLGQRTVIDRRSGAAIWSPAMRSQFIRAQQVGPSDAEALLRSKFGANQDIRCSGGRGKYFGCSVRVPSRDQPVIIYVFKEPGGGLKPMAGEKLPPELRTCKNAPGRSGAYRIC